MPSFIQRGHEPRKRDARFERADVVEVGRQFSARETEVCGTHGPLLDHAVVNVLTDLDAAAARFAALGFSVSPRGHHSLGSINHLVMFGRDYLELVGIERGATKIRQEIAEGPVGLNGVVLRSDDVRALHARFRAAGVPVLAPVDFERPVEVDGRAVPARFTTVRLSPEFLPGGRVYHCQHHTPELVWREPLPAHANGATGLAGCAIVAADPPATAARWARALGMAPDPVDGIARFDLAGVMVEIMSLDHYRGRYGASDDGLACSAARPGSPRRDFMGALALRTGSLARTRACLGVAAQRDAAVRWRDDGEGRLTLAAASAWDCPIDFVAGAA